MVGGDINNKLVCRLVSDFCNVTVYAGPVEATATGNALVHLIALGEVSDVWEARKIIPDNTDMKIYTPNPSDEIEKAYKEFLKY